MEKTLFCIRHGYALHNKLFWTIGRKAYGEFRDTPLLLEGYNQAKELNKKWKDINDVELVVISPCTRTMETAKFVFRDVNVAMISEDFLIEYPVGGYEICNQRKDLDHLKFAYPTVSFEQKNNEMVWGENEETKEELDERINAMFKWIGRRKEKTIAIVSHSSYIGRMKDRIIGDEKNELHHCYPYKLMVNYDENGEFKNFKEVDNHHINEDK